MCSWIKRQPQLQAYFCYIVFKIQDDQLVYKYNKIEPSCFMGNVSYFSTSDTCINNLIYHFQAGISQRIYECSHSLFGKALVIKKKLIF